MEQVVAESEVCLLACTDTRHFEEVEEEHQLYVELIMFLLSTSCPLTMDCRRRGEKLDSIYINRSAVDGVSSFKFLCVHITQELSWDEHTGPVVKKAQQGLFHLKLS